jgi:hypothetical protein
MVLWLVGEVVGECCAAEAVPVAASVMQIATSTEASVERR